MSHDSAGRSFRFSLKSLLIVIDFVRITLGWWIQYSRLSQALANEQQRREEIRMAANVLLLEQLRPESVIGQPISNFPIETLTSSTFDKSVWLDQRWRFHELHEDGDEFEPKEIPTQGKFKGYYFPKGDDGEGSPWGYCVIALNDVIFIVAHESGSLD
jgi:hypothetical protein